MKRLLSIPLIMFLLFGSEPVSYGQEALRPVQSYPQLQGGPVWVKTGSPVIELPFIDDFSAPAQYPDQNKWLDSHTYVNRNFGDDSPGIGVVTLDAMDSTGAIYERANSNRFVADYLTSTPLNLDFGADTTVYLSFYYQPQGLGDAPEPRDSLVLEFFAPSLNRWVWIWSTPGSPNKAFEQVLIPVRDALFLTSGFQFRFFNYASLADAFEASMIANADHWHLDYIYLDRGRHYQDIYPEDLCLQRHTGSLLLDYEAIPWQHFKMTSINEVATIFPVHLKNLSNTTLFFEPVFRITDLYGTTDGFTRELFADETDGPGELSYDATFNYGFTSDAPDSAIFRIELDLRPVVEDLIPGNSSATYEQIFTNYYAYDDGSAENGYGLAGEGTNNAQIAVRYVNFNPGDSLKGLSVFFNRSYQDANIKYFQLALWEEQDGQPGDLIYVQSGARAGVSQGLTGFDFFELDTAQVVPGVFYAGLIQVTPDFLNIGFDVNRDHSETIFYRRDIEWKKTSFQGSLMIRPVFANAPKKTGVDHPADPRIAQVLGLYPNPASGDLWLDLPDHLQDVHIRIFSQEGRIMYDEAGKNNKLDIRKLPAGWYVVDVRHREGRLTSRFIKL